MFLLLFEENILIFPKIFQALIEVEDWLIASSFTWNKHFELKKYKDLLKGAIENWTICIAYLY